MITKSSVPRLYRNLHIDKIEKHLLLYNPNSDKGISVIENKYAFILDLINGENSVGRISTLVKRKMPVFDNHALLKLLNLFDFHQILTFNKQTKYKLSGSKVLSSLGVWMHITNQCNLRCRYCYIYKTKERMSKKLSEKVLKKVIDTAEKYKYKKITVKLSGGECLLELKQIIDLVHLGRMYAAEKEIEVVFVVLTNGTLITEKTAKLLKMENIQVAVSLDGLGKYHDSQRVFADGSGSFAYVEKGIQNLQKAGASFNLSVVITSRNIENIPALTKYLMKHNAPFVFSFYRENPNVKEDMNIDHGKLIKYMKEAYRLIYKNPLRISINSLLDRVYFSRPHLQVCSMGKDYIVVGPRGTLSSCQMTIEKPTGSIEDDDVIKTIREGTFVRPKTLTVEDKTPCKDCQWKYICCGGCPYLTYCRKGSYATGSPYCEVYKALIPEVLKIEAKKIILRNKLGMSNKN